MNYRAAINQDIPSIMTVRNSVHENRLSDPDSITAKDIADFLNSSGKCWICEVEHQIVGFVMIDHQKENLWALFIRPEFAGKGIGKKLHKLALDWYFSQSKEIIQLNTSPKTIAEKFYKKLGWKEVGKHGKDEIKLELSLNNWKKFKR